MKIYVWRFVPLIYIDDGSRWNYYGVGIKQQQNVGIGHRKWEKERSNVHSSDGQK